MFDDLTHIDFDPRADDPYDGRTGDGNRRSMLTFYILAFAVLIGGGLLFRLFTDWLAWTQ